MPDLVVDGELRLFGVVGNGGWTFDGFSSIDVYNALAKIGRKKDVTIRLNSPGGIASEGVAIYNALRAHPGKKTIYVEAVAASAASVIAMAGDDTIMRLGSYMMVHDPAMLTVGPADEHEKAIEQLNTLGDSIAEIYAERAGISAEEARELMREETWLTAKQAVERNFAHRTDKAKATEATAFDYRLFSKAPKTILNLCDARGWSKRENNSPSPDEESEPTMTDAEKAAAEQARKDAEAKALADATAKAQADATARATGIMSACTEAGFPLMAAALVADPTATVDSVKAKAAEWGAIATMCAQAKKANPKLEIDALEFVKAGQTAAQVSVALIDKLAAGQGEDVNNHHDGTRTGGAHGSAADPFAQPSKETVALWDHVHKQRYPQQQAGAR